jgi:hypothetical protein
VEKASVEWRGEWSGLIRTGLEGQEAGRSGSGRPSPPVVSHHVARGVRGQETERWSGLGRPTRLGQKGGARPILKMKIPFLFLF